MVTFTNRLQKGDNKINIKLELVRYNVLEGGG